MDRRKALVLAMAAGTAWLTAAGTAAAAGPHFMPVYIKTVSYHWSGGMTSAGPKPVSYSVETHEWRATPQSSLDLLRLIFGWH